MIALRPGAALPPVTRFDRDGPLILSVHVQKTAGSRFGRLLRHAYGDALGLYYGKDDPRTHAVLRDVHVSALDAAALEAVAAAGVRVLHGHMQTRVLWKAVPDPARYWVWVREPIEHTVSHYHFIKSLPRETGAMVASVHDEIASLEAFAATARFQNLQSRMVPPAPLEKLGFLGVTELFAPMLPLLGLHDRAMRGNVNAAKPLVDIATRRALSVLLTEDLALYSGALEIALRRLGTRERRRRGIGARIARLVRR